MTEPSGEWIGTGDDRAWLDYSTVPAKSGGANPVVQSDIYKRSPQGIKTKKQARMDLLPPEAVWEVATVLGKAADGKYAPRNWERGLESGDLVAAALRHIFEWMGGKESDEETNCSPLAHAICVLMFARTLQIRGLLQDNRTTSADLDSLKSVVTNPGDFGSLKSETDLASE